MSNPYWHGCEMFEIVQTIGSRKTLGQDERLHITDMQSLYNRSRLPKAAYLVYSGQHERVRERVLPAACRRRRRRLPRPLAGWSVCASSLTTDVATTSLRSASAA